MANLLSFFSHTIRGDTYQIYRSLLLLRLCVLIAVGLLVLLVGSDRSVSIDEPQLLFASLLAISSWSLLRLQQTKGNGELSANIYSSLIKREMMIDYSWIFLIVFLTGKSANPFIYYYLVLVAIGSLLFLRREAWGFCLAAISAYTVMLTLDMGQHYKHIDSDFRLHLLGMWINFIGASLITCFFVSSLADALRKQQNALAQAREANLKNEQLIGIGTVAASTVHALATPLSTLNLLIDELLDNTQDVKDATQDLQLMQQQIARCKDTMKKLARISNASEKKSRETIRQLINDLEEYYLLNSPDKYPSYHLPDSSRNKVIKYDLLFRHALINLINNALESSTEQVDVSVSEPVSGLRIIISNQLPENQREQLESWGETTESDKLHGLGIGSFLANSTIESLGGSVQLDVNGELDGLLAVNVVVQMPAEFYCEAP